MRIQSSLDDVEEDLPGRCVGPHRVDRQPPELVSEDPLCIRCRERSRRAIGELPRLYAQLYVALQPSRGALSERVRRSQTAPMPIRGDVDELMRRILDVALCWAEVVRDVAGLSDQLAPRPLATHRLRLSADATLDRRLVDRPADATSGPALDAACATLAAHYPALLVLPPTPVVRRLTLEQLAEFSDRIDDETSRVNADGATVVLTLDGAAAALELLDLATAAYRLTGQTLGKDRLPALCPSLECGAAALIRWHGADQVDCEECGRYWPEEEYRRLVLVLVNEQSRAAAGEDDDE